MKEHQEHKGSPFTIKVFALPRNGEIVGQVFEIKCVTCGEKKPNPLNHSTPWSSKTHLLSSSKIPISTPAITPTPTEETPMSTTETQRPTHPRFCSDEAIQEMYNIIDDLALYAKDRDSTTVHITVKEAIAVVESALARRRFQLAVRAKTRGRSPYEQQPRQEP